MLGREIVIAGVKLRYNWLGLREPVCESMCVCECVCEEEMEKD